MSVSTPESAKPAKPFYRRKRFVLPAGLLALVIAANLTQDKDSKPVAGTSAISSFRDTSQAPSSPPPASASTTPAPTTSPASTPTTSREAPAPASTPTVKRRVALVAAAGGLPDKELTPGSVFAAATASQVCVSGYSRSVRRVSTATRREVFTAYGISYPPASGKYQLDHLVPLELGGDNTVANLWPQIYHGAGSADVKDHLENHLHDLVCAGQLPLRTAQRAMQGDWVSAAAKYNAITVHGGTPATTSSTPKPTPTPTATATSASVYYANCTAVRNAGAAPISAGDPGYSRKLDRDGDGIACE